MLLKKFMTQKLPKKGAFSLIFGQFSQKLKFYTILVFIKMFIFAENLNVDVRNKLWVITFF